MASMIAAAFVCTQAIFWDEQLNCVVEFATAVMLPRLEVWMVTADEVTLVTRPITSSRCENCPAARSVCVDAGGSVVAVNALVEPRLTAVTVCPVNVSVVPRLAFKARPACWLAPSERFMEAVAEPAAPPTVVNVLLAQPGTPGFVCVQNVTRGAEKLTVICV